MMLYLCERKCHNISLNENNLGIIGASMGALALNIAIEYPDLFQDVLIAYLLIG